MADVIIQSNIRNKFMRKTLKQKFDEANKQGINVPSELISNDDIVGVYGFFACGDGCSFVPTEIKAG